MTTVATSWVEPHSVRPPSMQFERAPIIIPTLNPLRLVKLQSPTNGCFVTYLTLGSFEALDLKLDQLLQAYSNRSTGGTKVKEECCMFPSELRKPNIEW